MKWGSRRLDEIAAINPKLEVVPRPHDFVSFVPMAAVSEQTASIESAEDRVFEGVSNGYTQFRRGDIIVAKITPCFQNGKMAHAVDLKYEVGIGSTEFHVFRPSDQLDGAYLFHLLGAPVVRAKGVGRMKGAAGQRRVPEDYFAALRIPLPPLAEQKRIAGILDAADALRAKSREALAQLDTLLQSTFLHMFGDPVTNPMGLPVRALSEFYIDKRDGTKCGPFGSALKKHELVNSGVPVWNMDNIDPSGRMVLPFRMWITEDKYRELEAYSVIDGDVIISRAGTVGKMCVTSLGAAASIISTNGCNPPGARNYAAILASLELSRA
jgi:type I restriction enzyme, S subunit